MTRLLIVEDSAQIRELVAKYFERTGAFEVDVAKDGVEGLTFVEKNEYDLAILDIMLPGASGFDLCKILRRKSNCPIIFLTALGNEDNILKGYALGADEYMVKPFSLKVLYAKTLALLSRTAENGKERNGGKILRCGSVLLDPLRMEVKESGVEVPLAPKEYLLLKVLMENRGQVLGRDRLLDLVWGVDFEGNDRVVDSHIKKLRKKLGESGSCIKTVIGGGYKVTT
ncbi:MAG: response regulator transcription factor [Clostridiales bacterium]|nr:response regulator transcription factor [Clostridiales bacterium]